MAFAQAASWVFYQSPALGAYGDRLIHGFTGKPHTLGGQATPRDEVLENRRLLGQVHGLAHDRLIVPEQVHSATVRPSDAGEFSACDAVMVTDTAVPALVLVADCVPIIVYDPEHHVGAVIHAGWRGTAGSIALRTVEALQNHCGSRPETLIAAIGPAIGPCCYEVSEAVAHAVAATTGNPPEAVVRARPAGQSPHLDLKRANALQLAHAGVQAIDTLPLCTRCETASLWSHRRGETGRQGAFLQLLP